MGNYEFLAEVYFPGTAGAISERPSAAQDS